MKLKKKINFNNTSSSLPRRAEMVSDYRILARGDTVRISVAEEQLKKTDDTIAKIASSVGINDPIYFNKLFHKYYQISPNEYRKKYK